MNPLATFSKVIKFIFSDDDEEIEFIDEWLDVCEWLRPINGNLIELNQR